MSGARAFKLFGRFVFARKRRRRRHRTMRRASQRTLILGEREKGVRRRRSLRKGFRRRRKFVVSGKVNVRVGR